MGRAALSSAVYFVVLNASLASYVRMIESTRLSKPENHVDLSDICIHWRLMS